MPALAKNVMVIPAKKTIGTQKVVQAVQKTRVAAYCRVSTDNEEQESSYEVQVEHYTYYIASNPAWEFVGIYADDGISGTSTKKRDDFNRMMDDCRAGKIDKILVKSISRFARNTVDCLKFTRELKDLNIAVYFEKENIDTLDVKGEVMITIMAALAQQESESLAANVRLGIEYRNQQGKVQVNHNRFLGYTKNEEGKLVIVPEEAEIVRRIYTEYLNGKSLLAIRRGLETDGIRNGAGNLRWHESNLKQILTNEKYIGDAILQKTYTVNTLEKKRDKNNGKVPKYYVEGCHEAIIPKDTYLRVQEELVRRANLQTGSKKRVYSGKYALSSIVFCAHCGDIFRRIVWNNSGKRSVVWRCVSRVEKGGPDCAARTVNEQVLQEAVIEAINKLFAGKSSTIKRLRQNIEDVVSSENAKRLSEIDILLKANQTALLEAGQDEDKVDEIGGVIENLRNEKQKLMTDSVLKADFRERIDDMMAFLDEQTGEAAEYSEPLVRRLVEKVTIYDDRMTIEFKAGISVDIEK